MQIGSRYFKHIVYVSGVEIYAGDQRGPLTDIGSHLGLCLGVVSCGATLEGSFMKVTDQDEETGVWIYSRGGSRVKIAEATKSALGLGFRPNE